MLGSAALALAVANARYWLAVAPSVQRELRRWDERARAIPDPVLREHALAKLRDERFNAEVAATLATLAPRAARQRTIVAMVALQVIYDYLDAVSEQPVADPLGNGRCLYGAFATALGGTDDGDRYRHSPQRDDGGYLDELAATCREAFATLPAAAAVGPTARRAAARCGEAQTRTHAIPQEGVAQLTAWATAEAEGTGLSWWEAAAGAAASVLTVHALIAAAADHRTTAAEAVRIEAAYLPISAITTLLDSLIDDERDRVEDGHSFLAYYPDSATAAARIGTVARDGAIAAWTLRCGPHHAMTVTGAAAYYLSAPGAASVDGRPVARRVVGELQPLIAPILLLFRVWRLAKCALRWCERRAHTMRLGAGVRTPT